MSNEVLVGSAFHAHVVPLTVKEEDAISAQFREGLPMVASPPEPCTWTSEDRRSFLIGLVLFRKNFAKITKFIGDKTSQTTLMYYFGKFRLTEEYETWRSWRKGNSRRRFICNNYEEMILWLPSDVTDEEEKTTLKYLLNTRFTVSCLLAREYAKGRVDMEKSIFNLRDVVGVKRLVDALLIGIKLLDLTIKNVREVDY